MSGCRRSRELIPTGSLWWAVKAAPVLFFVFFAPFRGYLSATTWRALRHWRQILCRFASRWVCGHEHNLALDGAAQSHFPDSMAG
jgi:hypothetical protein